MAYIATGLLASDRIHLSQRGNRVFAQGLGGAHWQGFKLDVKGEGEHTGPAGDKLWGDT